MSEHPVAGGARVSRRALVDIIRPAVAGSYGVTGFVAHTTIERLLGWCRLADPGIRVSTREGLAVDLDLTVAFGLPVAEVARQADSAVRYALRRALGRDVDRLTIRVGGMRYAGEHAATAHRTAATGHGGVDEASDGTSGNGSVAPHGSGVLAALGVTVEEAE